MDQAIRQAYRKLYERYPAPAKDVGCIPDTISEVTSAEDAKHFMLVNFTEMIVQPLKDRADHDRLRHLRLKPQATTQDVMWELEMLFGKQSPTVQ